LKNIVIARAPYRIGLLGGGTDIESVYSRHGGATINCAIDKYCYVTTKRHSPSFNEGFRINYSKTEVGQDLTDIQNNIIRETLRYFRVDFPIYVETNGDMPLRSGLGSSSSFTVALVAALGQLLGIAMGPLELAETAVHIEVNMVGSPIGKQDQYAAAFGGLNLYVWHETGEVDIRPISNSGMLRDFFEGLFVIYSNQPRSANSVLSEQADRFELNAEIYKGMRQITLDLYDFVKNKNENSPAGTNRLIKALEDSWKLKLSIHENVLGADMKDSYDLLRGDFDFLKVSGAGGGGFFWGYSRKNNPSPRAGFSPIHVAPSTGVQVVFSE